MALGLTPNSADAFGDERAKVIAAINSRARDPDMTKQAAKLTALQSLLNPILGA